MAVNNTNNANFIPASFILGARINRLDMIETLCQIDLFIQTGGFHQIITLNAEMLYAAQENSELLSLINGADLVLPDGHGIVWACNYLKQPVPERVTGIDLLQEMLHQGALNGWRFYFLGGRPNVAKQAAQLAKEKYPNLQIVGMRHGYFVESEEADIVEEIASSGADILCVGLGFPRQDQFIQTYGEKLNTKIAIGVGGSFDVLAGLVKRAPVTWQKLGLEWLWRLCLEPSRWRRILALPKFKWLVYKTAWTREDNKNGMKKNTSK